MKEFNEKPFKKDTPVQPFSNGTEFMNWHGRNCDECVNYENESTSQEKAKCKLAYHLDLASVLYGTVPLWVAREIGCDYIPLYGSVYLFANCSQKETGNEPF